MKKILFLLLATLISCIPELTPPSVEITSPAEGAEFPRGEMIEVRVDAADDDGTIEEIRLYVDDIGVAFIEGFPYSLSFPTEDMDVGSHTIKVVVSDDDRKEAEASSEFVLSSTLPVIQTEHPTVITRDSVIIGANILSDGGSSIQKAGFLWGTEANNIQNFIEEEAELSEKSFHTTLNNLTAETIYVLAFAENDKGRALGELISFNTIAPENLPPVCEILSPSNGSEYTHGDDIQINLSVEDDENAISEVKIYVDFKGIASLRTFPFNYTLANIELDAGFHSLLVEVSDIHGESTSATVLFNIVPTLPVIETNAPASISESEIIAGGSILSDGGGTVSSAGFIWGPEPYEESEGQDQPASIDGNMFSTTLGIPEYGSYYYIAYAENEAGRAFGEAVSFRPRLPDNMFVDERDNRAYQWIRIGTQVWMAENLAYLPVMKNSYNSSATDPYYYVYDYYGFLKEEALLNSNYDTYGVLYNYPAATEACPDGWHLPTVAEKNTLISFIGGTSQVGRLIEEGNEHWSNNSSGTNISGFSARGAGQAVSGTNGTNGFYGIQGLTGWWMSDTCTNQSGHALPFTIIQGNPFTIHDNQCTPFRTGYSVRCIKD